MSDIQIGPGQDGDYGERRARAERLRRHREGLCRNCGRVEGDHVRVGIAAPPICPTSVFVAPVEPLLCDRCKGEEHEYDWDCPVEKRRFKERLDKAMQDAPTPAQKHPRIRRPTGWRA